MTVNVTDTVGANNTIVLDGNSKIPAIDGSQVTALVATAFTTGTLATARIDVGTTAGKVLQLDGSARIPALSGTNLTNVPGPTSSTSDPAIDTNPTLGAKWINKTSGEVYICTDATAGENVWTNVGAGTGDIQLKYRGDNYGFAQGAGITPASNVIETFSLTSDGNATDHADLTYGRQYGATGKSTTYGYFAGGDADAPLGGYTANIEKFPFATQTNGTSVGNLTQGRRIGAGTAYADYSYCMSGGGPSNSAYDLIDKWAHSSDGNATSVGGVVQPVQEQAQHSSNTYGYMSGGRHTSSGGPSSNGMYGKIEKHSFATDADSTTVGNLTISTRRAEAGTQSKTYGYTMAGRIEGSPPVSVNSVEKFSFASDGNGTDLLDLTLIKRSGCGHASVTHGYYTGGVHDASGNYLNVIEKFSFSAETNATDVGDLTQLKAAVGTNY